MSEMKLKKMGKSLGIIIPKCDLDAAGFDESFEYELISEKGVISLFRRPPHVSKWVFENTALSDEDNTWVESELDFA